MLFVEDLIMDSSPNRDSDGTRYVYDKKCFFVIRDDNTYLIFELRQVQSLSPVSTANRKLN
jgi:hypothetical protein